MTELCKPPAPDSVNAGKKAAWATPICALALAALLGGGNVGRRSSSVTDGNGNVGKHGRQHLWCNRQFRRRLPHEHGDRMLELGARDRAIDELRLR
jgi:hypothetical protein